jgi:uncharacterized damage-inducible protein DinB
MTTATPVGESTVLREQVQAVHRTLRANTKDLTQEDSLLQPQGGGNCLNWVVGHLLSTWDVILPLVGQQPVMGKQALARYERGTAELDDASEALQLETLLNACDDAVQRMDEGLAQATTESLDRPAPFSPRKNPDETVRSLLSIVVFHQGYHTGQTAILRRMTGKPGAIR